MPTPAVLARIAHQFTPDVPFPKITSAVGLGVLGNVIEEGDVPGFLNLPKISHVLREIEVSDDSMTIVYDIFDNISGQKLLSELEAGKVFSPVIEITAVGAIVICNLKEAK